MRTGLELVALRESIAEVECPIKWVHSDTMLANSLTKGHGKGTTGVILQKRLPLEDRLRRKVRERERRKNKGLGALEQLVDYAVEDWGDLSEDDDPPTS